MDRRVLVAYASKAGSTAEIAEEIGKVFAERSFAVDVLPAKNVTDLSRYRAVVLGSAIRIGKILPDAMSFIERNQETLRNIPFSLFVVCLTMREDESCNRQTVRGYLDPVYKLVEPARLGLFAGALNSKRLGLSERMLMKALKAADGDYRQWDQIDDWARGLPTL